MEKSKTDNLFCGLHRWQIVAILIFLWDVVTIIGAHFAALWFRFDCRFSMIPQEYLDGYMRLVFIHAGISVLIYGWMHLYNSLWRYASYLEMVRTVVAITLAVMLYVLIGNLTGNAMPRSYYIFGALLQAMCSIGIRFSYRFVRIIERKHLRSRNIGNARRVMLIGGGEAGKMILNDLKTAKETKDYVVCIIDDDRDKWGRYINGVLVEGGRDMILSCVKKYKVDKIFLAIPSASAQEKRDILNICKETNCELKNLPGMFQLYSGEVTVEHMKDVSVEDLLGREPVKVDNTQIFEYLANKVVLITGAGGSIGSELSRQIAAHAPRTLVLFDVYENSVYDLQLELKEKYPDMDLQVLIGSVRDSRRMDHVFSQYRPEVVFHAAAHKHVPLMEDSPCEAIKNNAIGTYKTGYAAMKYGCKRFVLISTDKAVNPTNAMGASKRICEMIVQSFAQMIKERRVHELPMMFTHLEKDLHAGDMNRIIGEVNTEFVAVRFGNVLGSNGSVIPIFKKQIEKGGPVTVTHPDIIRYFMTIPEAVSLVLQASTYAKGGEIFVLDMGVAVKIDQLARNLIRLSGYTPDVDIKIAYTGLRPGEKLYEEKLMAEEGLERTENEMIHIGKPLDFDINEFLTSLQTLMLAAYQNDPEIRNLMMQIVDTYIPAGRNGSVQKGALYEAQMVREPATRKYVSQMHG